MTELLVSVRSVDEAEAALGGGAGLIDIKEPRHGPLGRAGDAVISAVCEFVAARRPVSAALGELLDDAPLPHGLPLRYVKWGLAGCAHRRDWRNCLHSAGRRLEQGAPVAVAYADWESARSPPPVEVCSFAGEHHWEAFLLDTWEKQGRTLLDQLSIEDIARLREICGKNGVRVAIAGSLTTKEIEKLRHLRPDWFAVRGAVCAEGKRTQPIDAARVRALTTLLNGSNHGS